MPFTIQRTEGGKLWQLQAKVVRYSGQMHRKHSSDYVLYAAVQIVLACCPCSSTYLDLPAKQQEALNSHHNLLDG